MRRFFSRNRPPSSATLVSQLEAGEHSERLSALAQIERLREADRHDDTLQQALVTTAAAASDVGIIQRILALLTPDRITPELIAAEPVALAFLAQTPRPADWPTPLRDDPQLLRLHLRQRLQQAASADAAIAELTGPAVAALALEDRLALWITRRDLKEALFEQPEAATAEGLQLIERMSRGHDKSVNRIARQRLQAQKDAAAAAAAAHQRAAELRDSAARLIEEARRAGVRTPKDDAAMAALLEQWQPFAGAEAPLPDWPDDLPTAQALAARAAAEAAEREAAAAAEREQAEQAEAAAAVAVAVAVADADAGTVPNDPASDQATADAAPAAGPTPEPADQSDGTASGPDTAHSEPGATPAAEDPARAAERRERLAAASELLTELEQAVEAGSTRTAGPLLARLRSTLGDDLRLPKQQRSRLNAAQARVREWGQWQTYATSPKRGELLTAMQAAAEAPLAPELQAEKIKELRARWRELGPPRGAAEREQVAAFDAAAETAFEPCRTYFAELGAQREANAQAREALCETLSKYLDETDWAKADYDAAEKILRQARTDWRALHPVPRKRERALSERFEGLQEQLYGRLQQHWNRRRAAKEGLVQRAEALLADSTPLNDRIEQAKQLQRDWQQAGRLPRKDDQALWTRFRAALDALFESREARFTAARNEQAAQEQAITAALTDLSASIETPTPAALQQALAVIEPLLEALPPRERRRQEAEVERHSSAYRRALQAVRAEQRLAQVQLLLDWDRAAAEGDPLPDEAPAALAGADCSEPVPVLREFVLRCEMRADIDSSSTDREQRMQLKLAQLERGLGRTDELATLNAHELAERWCQFGPKREPGCAELRERLAHALRELS
ncbi:MAG: DUF349 domain-containing protein [Pseudomonadota bacterium]